MNKDDRFWIMLLGVMTAYTIMAIIIILLAAETTTR